MSAEELHVETDLCRYCGFPIEERDQDCAALEAGCCEP